MNELIVILDLAVLVAFFVLFVMFHTDSTYLNKLILKSIELNDARWALLKEMSSNVNLKFKEVDAAVEALTTSVKKDERK